MWIFGPLVAPRTSAWTSTLASASESVVTESPSTRRTAGSDRLSPGAVVTLSISMTSPTATFCCWPPLRTIAYTSDLLSSVGLHLGGVRRRVAAGEAHDVTRTGTPRNGRRAEDQVYGSDPTPVKTTSRSVSTACPEPVEGLDQRE